MTEADVLRRAMSGKYRDINNLNRSRKILQGIRKNCLMGMCGVGQISFGGYSFQSILQV